MEVTVFVAFGHSMGSSEFGVDPVKDDWIPGQVMIAAQFGDLGAIEGFAQFAVRAPGNDDRLLAVLDLVRFNFVGRRSHPTPCCP